MFMFPISDNPELRTSGNFIPGFNSIADKESFFEQNSSSVLENGGIGYQFLEYAVKTHNYEFAKNLLERGVDRDPPNGTRASVPLVNLACLANDETTAMKFIKLLNSFRIDFNQQSVINETPLMMCCDRGYLEAVDYLLKLGADVNAQSTSGWTALFYAASKSNYAIVEKLLAAGANKTVRDRKDRTALYIASARHATEICELLQDANNQSFTSVPSYARKDAVEEACLGFPGHVVDVLSQMNLSNYSWAITNGHKMKFGDFLNISDEKLKETGVYFSIHRHMITEFVRSFHITAWDTKAIGLGEKGTVEQTDLVDCLILILNIIFHIHVHRSTLHFLKSHYNKQRYPDDIRSNIIQRITEIRTLLPRLTELMNVVCSFSKRVNRINMLEDPYLITKDF